MNLTWLTRGLALGLLGLLFGLNVHRATTQSIVHDEALTYQFFLSGPWSDVWTNFNANNHVLHTLLCRASVALFGVSELTLRLPSLCGGLLYFAGVFCLARLAFGERGLFMLAVMVLSMNPLVLDYLSAARGYGLAIAFLMWAVHFVLRFDPQAPQLGTMRLAGLCAGLSVSANLTLLFPVTGLAMVLLAWVWWERRTWSAVWPVLLQSILPAALVMAAFLAVPLWHAEPGAFYVGAPTVRLGFESLVRASCRPDLPNAGASWTTLATGLLRMDVYGVALCVAVVLAGAALAGLRWGRSKAPLNSRPIAEKLLLLVAATMVVTMGGVVLSHWVLGYPYPELRTGLYWIPLTTLAALAWVRGLSLTAALLPAGLLVVLVTRYASAATFPDPEFQYYYIEWRYDAGNKAIMQRIRELEQARLEPPSVRVGASWVLEPSLNFYRERWGLRWLQEIRRTPVGEVPSDYYVLTGDDRRLLAAHPEWRVVEEDTVSGAVLVVARPK